MKKLALLFVLVMVTGVVFADATFDRLQSNHQNAMRFYGRADLLAQRDSQMLFVYAGRNVASVFQNNDMSTGYMENGDKKIYWEVTPIEGGIRIVVKINILGRIYEKVIIIKTGERELATSVEPTTDRVDPWCIVKCAGTAALKCLDCGTDWKCWAKCAAPDAISCIIDCFN